GAATGYGIFAQRYNAAGTAQLPREFRVNTYTSSSQLLHAVAADASGDFVVAWQSSGQDGDGDGIYAQRYLNAASPTMVRLKSQANEVLLPGDSLSHEATSLVVQFSKLMNTAGAESGAHSASNRANYQLLKNGIDV